MFKGIKQAVLYDIILPFMGREETVNRLQETENLLETYGGIVLVKIIQRRHHAGSTSFIGRSKFEEIIETSKEIKANLLIINASLKPSQIYHLRTHLESIRLKLEVWDRIDLILNIFRKHAKTAEAKLQIEMANIKHYGPTIYGMGEELSNQVGGIGTKGIGETNTEIMKRYLANRKKMISQKMNQLKKSRQLNRKRRAKNGFKTISLIGYTNAGKSSLFNALTKRKVEVKNVLFSTLDTTTSKLFLPKTKKMVLVSDTIGFIENLPPKLIDAFKSTLEETLYADLILNVVDINDLCFEKKIEHSKMLLVDLQCQNKKTIYVFNKCDLVQNKLDVDRHDFKYLPYVMVSAKKLLYLENLILLIEKTLYK